MKKFKSLLLNVVMAAVLLVGTGCGHLRLVADYDPQIDAGVTEFQRKAETFFVYLLRNQNNEKAEYSNNTAFYDDAKVEISLLKLRASASAKNEITLKQLSLLAENLSDMEMLHAKRKLTQDDIKPLRIAFEVSCGAILKFEIGKKRGEEIKADGN